MPGRVLRVLFADRRGSSWPIVAETDAGVRFIKLRGAAQGAAPLVAEVIVGALAEALGLRVPARALVTLPADVASEDRNDELADLLRASEGVNLAFAFLDDAHAPTPDDLVAIPPAEAAAIVWLDALVMNRDRSPGNPNLLCWHDVTWLVDHGAALPFHFAWDAVTEDSPRSAYVVTEPHLLSERAGLLAPWDDALASRITREVLDSAIAAVPDEFLVPLVRHRDETPGRRAAYGAFLWKRLQPPRPFLVPVIRPSPARRGRPDRLSR